MSRRRPAMKLVVSNRSTEVCSRQQRRLPIDYSSSSPNIDLHAKIDRLVSIEAAYGDVLERLVDSSLARLDRRKVAITVNADAGTAALQDTD